MACNMYAPRTYFYGMWTRIYEYGAPQLSFWLCHWLWSREYNDIIDRFRSRTRTSKTTWKWRQNGVAYPYMGTTRHFHVVFDVRVLDLNLSNHVHDQYCPIQDYHSSLQPSDTGGIVAASLVLDSNRGSCCQVWHYFIFCMWVCYIRSEL
jgi:hypothetical protein